MSLWDINRARQLAGLSAKVEPLTESVHDDDEDPDVRIANTDSKQREFENRNKKALDDGQKALADKKRAQEEAKKAKPKKEEEKEEPKKETTSTVDEKPEEAKKRGKAPNPESFNQHAKANAAKMSRGEFIKWAAETHGKGKNYASTLFAKYNPKSGRQVANESWIIVHPMMPSFLLAENREMSTYQWVDSTSPINPIIFETQAEAEKIQKHISEWRAQSSVLEKIVFEADVDTK